MRVLCLSPHTDDVEVGMGATVVKHVERGDEVHVVAFSWCDDKRLIYEMESAMIELGVDGDNWSVLQFGRREFPRQRQEILQSMWDYNHEFVPELVYVPASGDAHQDHEVVSREAYRAFGCSILGYESGRNTRFMPNLYEKAERCAVDKKLSALVCYTSQKESAHRERFFTSSDVLSRLMYHGSKVGVKYAEAFEVIKQIN